MRRLLCFLSMMALMAGCGKDTPSSPSPTSTIALSGNMNFGSATVGSSVTSTLTIANTGSASLVITSVTYPNNFTGNFFSGTIAPNGSQPVTVTFTPTAAQTFTGNITVSGNQSAGTNTIAVSGAGVAVPTFSLSGLVTETPPTTSTVITGVVVTIVDGANQGKTATTDASGRYQITGVVNGGYTVSASKAGYSTSMLPVGINGNTTLDFRLEPSTPRTVFGPGQYRVGTDMPAGRYYNDPASGCHYVRLKGFGGGSADAIADVVVNFDAPQWIVDVLPTDAGFSTDINCGQWFTTPRRGLAANAIEPGMWIIGAQITPGTYRAENAIAGCYWQRLSAFTGTLDAVIANQLASSSGGQLVTIANTDVGFSTTTECGTWIRTQ